MKSILTALAILILACSVYGQSATERLKNYNTKHNIILDGYDPISYFAGKPAKGSAEISYTYKGIVYNFLSQANLTKFKSNPDKFEPAYGGWCAYAMGATGEKVKVDPETYKIIDGKLYLFYNFWGNNTLNDWNENEHSLKSKADKNWSKTTP